MIENVSHACSGYTRNDHSNGADDAWSWTERSHSPDPEWKAADVHGSVEIKRDLQERLRVWQTSVGDPLAAQ